MKDMRIDGNQKLESRWSSFFVPVAAVVVVILIGVLIYLLSVSPQVMLGYS